jgi:transposase
LTIVGKLASDELWETVLEPLLPPELPKPKGGRPRLPPRAIFCGIVYVVKTGIPWGLQPREFGCSGVTCWRRLRHWRNAGVFERLHKTLLDRFSMAGRIDWSTSSLDSASTPAKGGASFAAISQVAGPGFEPGAT